jgi:hypothetical protein
MRGNSETTSCTYEFVPKETMLHHAQEVGSEAGASLDHADLSVGQQDQSVVDQFVVEGVAGAARHDVGFGFLVGQADGGPEVSSWSNGHLRRKDFWVWRTYRRR